MSRLRSKQTFKKLSIGTVLVLALVSLLVFAAFSDQEILRGGVLRAIGNITSDSSNPFLAAGQSLPGTLSMVYERLFYVNSMNGDETPLLGVSYEWSENSLKLTVKTRQGVLWSDGEAFSAQDVAFTFNYINEHPALDLSGIWGGDLTAVEAPDDQTVVFSFSAPNTPVFTYLATQAIVPEHIWSKIDDPVIYINEEPVGTGPFLVDSVTLQQFASYVRNPNYWMEGRPYIDRVNFSVIKTNDSALMVMLLDEVDYAFLYVPDVKNTFVARDPEVHAYYWPVANSNLLYLNTAKKTLDQVTFRKAVAMAIDKKSMSEKIFYGDAGAADPTGILPAQLDEWGSANLKAMSYNYDPDGARKVLKDAGFSWDAAGNLLGLDGESLPVFKILVGSGWTDFIGMAQIISNDLEVLGIKTSIDQQSWGGYIGGIQNGTYDMAICWSTGAGPTPYYFYYKMLSPEFSATEIGDTALSNYARFTDPAVTAALASYRATSDPTAQLDAIHTIAQVVLENVPFIPLTDRPSFICYNTSTFVGFPSDENPYNDGCGPEQPGAEIMYLNVHLK